MKHKDDRNSARVKETSELLLQRHQIATLRGDAGFFHRVFHWKLKYIRENKDEQSIFASSQINIYKLKIKQKIVAARTHAKSVHARTDAHVYVKRDHAGDDFSFSEQSQRQFFQVML